MSQEKGKSVGIDMIHWYEAEQKFTEVLATKKKTNTRGQQSQINPTSQTEDPQQRDDADQISKAKMPLQDRGQLQVLPKKSHTNLNWAHMWYPLNECLWI